MGEKIGIIPGIPAFQQFPLQRCIVSNRFRFLIRIFGGAGKNPGRKDQRKKLFHILAKLIQKVSTLFLKSKKSIVGNFSDHEFKVRPF
jgi:hypothetical protein